MTEPPSQQPLTPTEQIQLLFVRHEALIRAFITSLVPQLADADDVLQETFLTVTRKADSFIQGSNFLAWVFTIARLKVLEQHRKNRRTTDLSESAVLALIQSAPSPEHLETQAEALRRCIERLSPKARDILWRRYTGRQSSEMMAEALGMTALAIRMVLTKSRSLLRDCMQSELSKLEA